jgi:hypothetical protein
MEKFVYLHNKEGVLGGAATLISHFHQESFASGEASDPELTSPLSPLPSPLSPLTRHHPAEQKAGFP